MDGSGLKPAHLRKTDFGRRLYRLMLEQGWNQSDLAREAGLPRDSISVYIRGKSMPTPQSLAQLAKALKVTAEELLPNIVENAINEDAPSLSLMISDADPTRGWLRINRAVSMSTATRIMELLNNDAPLAHSE